MSIQRTGVLSLALGSSAVSQPRYRPDIDGLRAVAVLSVLGFHAFPEHVPGGFVGVDIFFVISGFLISGIIFRALTQGSFDLFDFYSRRVRRIFPALISVLITVWAFGWLVLLSDEYELLGKYIVAGAGFVLNLELAREGASYFNSASPLTHLWSLGVEEQFYLIWPLLLVVIWKFPKGQFAFIVAIATISFAACITATYSDPVSSFYLPSSRLWELSLGAALAYVQMKQAIVVGTNQNLSLQEFIAKRAVWSRLFNPDVRGIIGAVLLLFSFVSLGDVVFPSGWALIPSVGAMLIISAGSHSWINRKILSRHAVVFIGLISYPLYLWHWPLLVFLRIVSGWRVTLVSICIVILTAFFLAFLTYRYIELPLRQSRRKGEKVGALCASMAICACIGYLALVAVIPARSQAFNLDRYIRAATEEFPPNNKFWGSGRLIKLGTGSKSTLFIGDSHIFQYYSRIEKVLSDHPLNSHGAVFAGRGGCAFGTHEITEFRRIQHGCKQFFDDAIEYGQNPHVDRIVIGAFWALWFAKGDGALRRGSKRALDSLEGIVKDYLSKGKRVYLVLDVPFGMNLAPKLMIRRTLFPPDFSVDIKPFSRAEMDRIASPIIFKLIEIAERTGAIVIDPMTSLCEATTCSAVTPTGEPMYWDVSHLRPSYVREHVRFLDGTVLD